MTRPALLLRVILLSCCVLSLGACSRNAPDHQQAVGLPTGVVTPDLRVDGYQASLSLVTYMTVGADGTIVVDQPQDARLLFFGPDGQRLGEFGRRGDGPGEFARLGPLGWRGDTLWVFDLDLHRFTMISHARKLLATLRAPLFADAPSKQVAMPATQPIEDGWLLPDGDLVLEALIIGQRQPNAYAGMLKNQDGVYLRVSRAGTFKGLLASWSLFGEQCRWNSGMAVMTVPECARPLQDFGDRGERLATVVTDVSGLHPGTYQVTLQRTTGDTIFDRRYPFTAVPITRHAADSIRARLLARSGPSDSRHAVENVPFPPFYPPVALIRVGRDSTTWIGLRQTAQGHPWIVLDDSGNPIGQVTLPPSMILSVADRHTIWGVDWDQNDMPSIVRYRITWPKP